MRGVVGIDAQQSRELIECRDLGMRFIPFFLFRLLTCFTGLAKKQGDVPVMAVSP